MTGKERIISALNVEQPDHVPLYIHGNLVGGSFISYPPPYSTARTGQVSRSSISD